MTALRARAQFDPMAHAEQEGAELDEDLANIERAVAAMQPRLGSIEARMPHAISRVAVVNYDAFGNITGQMSRSVAILDENGSGLVFTVLVGRSETMFYTKQVVDGHGADELSPEEQASVAKALARRCVTGASAPDAIDEPAFERELVALFAEHHGA